MKNMWSYLIAFVLVVCIGFIMRWVKNMKPFKTSSLNPNPRPTTSYDEAIARLKVLQAQDGEELNPLCYTQLRTHGHKTENVLVYLHGFTNCPQQFHQLAPVFFDKGYNVLMPRIPLHGMNDRTPKALGRLTAEELAQFTDEVVDIAQGLGDKVTVLGLSLGGTMAGWAAHYRDDIELAVLVGPLLAIKVMPRPIEKTMATIALNLPDIFMWWDPRVRLNMPPWHAYPGYSTHAMAQSMRLAYRVKEDAVKLKPQAKSALVISNAADLAVANDVIHDLIDNWRKNGAEHLHSYEFPQDMHILHDCLDPEQKDEQIDVVYPILLDLMNKASNTNGKNI